MATYNVRIFGHASLSRLAIDPSNQGGTDSVMALSQPYVWGQSIAVTVSGGAVSSAVAAPVGYTRDSTQILHIEVPDGQVIGYEVNESSRSIVASANSPRLSVSGNIQFGAGWTLSIIDMTGVS